MVTAQEISEKRRVAGRLGGQALKDKYGDSYFRVIGKKGGRPRSRTLAEIKGEQTAPNNFKGGELPNSLRKLKELYVKKIGGDILSPPKGDSQSNNRITKERGKTLISSASLHNG